MRGFYLSAAAGLLAVAAFTTTVDAQTASSSQNMRGSGANSNASTYTPNMSGRAMSMRQRMMMRKKMAMRKKMMMRKKSM